MEKILAVEPGTHEFDRRAREGNLVPVSCEVIADLETPISAYLRLRDLPHPFLLESVEGGAKVARYSFLGAEPQLLLKAFPSHVEITEAGVSRRVAEDPLVAARGVLGRYRPVADPALPRFYGGLVGYFGYDLIRHIEHLPHQPPDDRGLPISSLALADTVMIFDHLRHRIRIVANAFVEEGADRAYRKARHRIEEWLERLSRPLAPPAPRPPATPLRLRSNMTREQYLAAAERCREYIHAGDAFQIVLSQRFAAEVGALDPLAVYRALRTINPSPFMFFLEGGEATLIGASPELMVRLEGDLVEMRPIAGTRRRGKDEAEDQRLEREMLASEKERAEHIMLVDLGRNDLGRVCEYGTVKVEKLLTVERYSHVMHIVSSLRGCLREDVDCFDALMACFPAGTVSGAPKVRAMEIIEELERTRRGIYAGGILYLDFAGNLDSCIALRTMVVKKGVAYVQAGGGIVADSTPEGEYQESVNKSKALLTALEAAERAR